MHVSVTLRDGVQVSRGGEVHRDGAGVEEHVAVGAALRGHGRLFTRRLLLEHDLILLLVLLVLHLLERHIGRARHVLPRVGRGRLGQGDERGSSVGVVLLLRHLHHRRHCCQGIRW